MPYINVDVDLDDFDIEDVVEYALESVGKLRKRNDHKRLNELKEYLEIDPTIKIESLDDRLKMEHIEKVFHKYSTDYFEKQLPC